MTTQETAWQAAESAAAALAPDADVLASVDAAGLGSSTLAVLRRAAAKPGVTTTAALRYWTSVAMAGPVAAARWMGVQASPPVPVPDGDKRFADRAWTDNPAFYALRQTHLATSRLINELLQAGAGNAMDDAKAALATGFLMDALAPTNFLFTNPAALKRAFETAGTSLVAGANHFVDDMLNNGGRPRQVDTRPFRVGENLAATPGKVVFKNDLMELIQYAPQTPRCTRSRCCQPAVDQQVLRHGPGPRPQLPRVGGAARAHRVRDLLPQPGLLHARRDPGRLPHPRPAGSARRHRRDHRRTQDRHRRPVPRRRADRHAGRVPYREGRRQVGSITLLNTLLDYSEPGVLGVFTDAKTVARLEKQMTAKGVLEGSQMAGTFDMLRANDLIFNYVVSNWLMGEEPPAFDILAWNGDSTRMPAAMHSFYLRSLYMRNELAQGELELAGQRLSLADVKNDTYVVGAINDHIVPWNPPTRPAG